MNVTYFTSPHADDRPPGTTIDLVVLHAITLPPGEFGNGGAEIVDFFLGRLDAGRHPYFRKIADMKVSAHFLLNRSGDLIQFVPIMRRAWHAGKSCWKRREKCNDFSIGIELEGDQKKPFEEVQYNHLAKLLHAFHPLKLNLNLNPEHIVGHSEISPGRKWDPGPMFDWDRLHASLKKPGDRSLWPSVIWT